MSDKQRYKYLDLGVNRVYRPGDEPDYPTGSPFGRQWLVSKRTIGSDSTTPIGRIADGDNGHWYAGPLMDRSPVDGNCPCRHVANSKLEAVYWLQGVHDANSDWFKRGMDGVGW